MIATATWVEVVWTLLCLLGGVLHVLGLMDALGDLRAQRRLRPQQIDLRRLARAHVRREAVRLVVMALFVALGVYALSRPGNVPTLSVPALVMPLLAIAVAALLAGDSLFDRLDRAVLLRQARAGVGT